MVDVRVDASDIDNLIRSIRKHGDRRALERELRAGLNRATKPVRGQLVEIIPAALPQRGGLAEQMKSKTTSRISAKSGKYAGVSMRFASRGHDIRTLTGKRLRHPVYGNRSAWVDQTAGVEPTVFVGEFEKQTPAIQRDIARVMEDVARKVCGF